VETGAFLMEFWPLHALFNMQAVGWFRVETQLIWGGLILFSVVAGWFDLRQRRIPNLWNISWLLIIAVLQCRFTSISATILSGGVMLVIMLIPTVLGVWGQGDWKMSIVYGIALGVIPALLIWLMGFLIAIIGHRVTTRLSAQFMETKMARSVPLATFMGVATVICYVGLSVLHNA
jgi:Flp pilus assembly protein protease CpaA